MSRSALIRLKKAQLSIFGLILACLLVISSTYLQESTVVAAGDTYEITFQAIGSGTIDPSGTQTYSSPATIPIMAVPNPGYSFVSWNSNPNVVTFSDQKASSTFATIIGNGTVTATFVQNTYTVSISVLPVVGAGTVTPNATGPYHYADTVVLTENPANGYTFSGWSGDGVGIGTTRTVALTANSSVIANFAQNNYTLSVTEVGTGIVSVNPNQTFYHYGDTAILTASPPAGWVFSGWSGSFTSNVNPISIKINGTTSAIATFTQSVYSVSVSILPSSSAGAVTSNSSGPLHLGDVVTLTETPANGYSFSDWSGDGTGTGTTRTVTVTGNMLVIARFTQNTYTLSVTTAGSGSAAINPNQASYHYGDTVVLTATASPGWAFSNWNSAVFKSSQNPATIIINSTTSVLATFTQTTYQIVFGTTSSGTTNPTGTQTYLAGQYVPLLATPAQGYTFSAWSASPTSSVKFDNASSASALATINGNGIISAAFNPKPSPTPTPTPTTPPTVTPTASPSPSSPPSSTPIPIPTQTSTPSTHPISTPTPLPTPIPNSITLTTLTDSGKNASLTFQGDIASSSISGISISTDESNTTTTLSLAVVAQSDANNLNKITIPNSAILYGDIPTAFVNNDIAQNQGYAHDANNYYVWFKTPYSTYALTITFETKKPDPGFPIWALIATIVIVIVSVLAVLISRSLRNKNFKFPQINFLKENFLSSFPR
jgi:hypothetical protein